MENTRVSFNSRYKAAKVLVIIPLAIAGLAIAFALICGIYFMLRRSPLLASLGPLPCNAELGVFFCLVFGFCLDSIVTVILAPIAIRLSNRSNMLGAAKLRRLAVVELVISGIITILLLRRLIP